MIYKIRQVTSYRYGATVPFARHLLRLTPVSRPGQVVLSSETTIEPAVYERRESRDFFGNHVTHVGIETPHQSFEVLSRSEVRVLHPLPVAEAATLPWEEVREAAAQWPSLAPEFACAFHLREPLCAVGAGDTGLRSRELSGGPSDFGSRRRADKPYPDDFAYDPAATETTTPIAEAFAMRHGVCQDFAHVMISGLRGLGLPAAYVSGYLRTMPPPGQPRLEGADATHAWVSLWCGPQHGWQGLDPTNALRTATDHIVLAVGRDFADVSPLDGVILVGGGHTHSVAVDVIPRDELNGTNPDPGE